MLAACTQDREAGFLMMCVEATAIYSAYAPCITSWLKWWLIWRVFTPPARPKTWSPTDHPATPGPISEMIPENSTPRIGETLEGRIYLPSRCNISMRLRPKALTWRQSFQPLDSRETRSQRRCVLLTYLDQNFLKANWRLRNLPNVEALCSTGPTFD